MLACLCALDGYTTHTQPKKSRVSTVDYDLRERVGNATNGCVNVFVDAGANIGIHTRFLFEPAKYPKSRARPLSPRSHPA